jgi:hypothetical protein
MRCREARRTLVAYLDGEVMPSERTLLESHLAGCPRCEQELATLGGGRRRVTESLRSVAAQASPSPRALARLQAALDNDRPIHDQRLGEQRMRLRWKIAYGTIAAVVLAAAIIAGVPSTRAAAGDFFAAVFHIEMKPLELGYLPDGFELGPVFQTGSVEIASPAAEDSGAAASWQSAEQKQQSLYQNGDQFLLVTTEKGSQQPLPDGEPAEVNGLNAVLQTGLSGTVDPAPALPAGAASGSSGGVASVTVSGAAPQGEGPSFEVGAGAGTVIMGSGVVIGGTANAADSGPVIAPAGDQPPVMPVALTYQNAIKLTWIVDGTRVEVLTNLPFEELLKVAEGLKLGDE